MFNMFQFSVASIQFDAWTYGFNLKIKNLVHKCYMLI